LLLTTMASKKEFEISLISFTTITKFLKNAGGHAITKTAVHDIIRQSREAVCIEKGILSSLWLLRRKKREEIMFCILEQHLKIHWASQKMWYKNLSRNSEDHDPRLPWYISLTDYTTLFIFEGEGSKEEQFFLVDKNSNRGSRSHEKELSREKCPGGIEFQNDIRQEYSNVTWNPGMPVTQDQVWVK